MSHRLNKFYTGKYGFNSFKFEDELDRKYFSVEFTTFNSMLVVWYDIICLFVSAVHFAPYLTGLSSMMLI